MSAQTLFEKRMESQQAEVKALREKYAPQMEMLDSSLLAQSKGGRLDAYDYWALGKSLEQFDEHMSYYEAEGSVGMMGTIPSVAYNVITVSLGTSILPVVASVQPIEEENGSLYFMTWKSGVTKGNYTANTKVLDPRDNPTFPQGYASNFVQESFNTSNGNLGAYTGTLGQLPIRPNVLNVSVATSPVITLVDDGAGNLIGVGAYGTINYTNGQYSITFLANPGTVAATISYQVNSELATSANIPSYDMDLTSMKVQAQTYALRGSIGLMQQHVMKKRFSLVAPDLLANTLVQQINAEVGGDAIRKLISNVPATSALSWDYTPPTGVPQFQHIATFEFKLNEMEGVISKAAGRGVITAIIAGIGASTVIANQAKFKKLTNGTSLGPVIFGTLDGVTVIRVPDATLCATNKVYCLYKSNDNPFEAPLVYGPFMPLTVTPLIPNINALTQQRAAAVWAALASVMPKFTGVITLSNLPANL